MSRRFQALAVVLQLAVAVQNPFCLADHISPRATTIFRGDFVPPCAQGCLLSFIKSGFPAAACPNPRDLSCLCTRRSTTGFTLGEGALRCVYAVCLNPGIRELQVYSICSGIRNALPNTHTAITITSKAMTTTQANPTTSTTISETTLPPTSSLSITDSSTLTAPTTSSTSTTLQSTTLSSSSTSVPTDPTGLPPEPPEPPATNDEPSMTSTQVIGASIGGAVAGALLLALIILLLLKRRRKKMMAAHESEFEIGGQMAEPSPHDFLAGYRGGRALGSPIGIYNEPVVRRLTHPSNITKQSEAAAPDIGNFSYPYPAYSHSGSDDASLSTPNATKSKSPRRISQLLPEKPNYEVYSSQHPITERLGRRPDSSTTVFEEDYDGDRKTLISANNHWPPAHPNGGYKNTSANRNYSQPQQYGLQYATYQNVGRQQPQHQQRRQRRQPPTLRLVTPASGNLYQGRTNMATSPPKVTYQRVGSGLSMRPNGTGLAGPSNLYPWDGAGAGAGAWRHGGRVDQNRRRAKDRTSAGSVTSFESVGSNDGNRNGNSGTVPKRTTVRLSPVRERSTSPDPNAHPTPLSKPLRYPPMNGRSASTSYSFQGQGHSERANDVTMGNGTNGGNSRLYPYAYPYPYPNPAGTAKNIPKFPKFHQPLRPPIPHPQPELQTQPQHQYQYSTHTPNEPRNSGTSSNSNSNSNNSLLSKRRGEAMADKMENELDVNKASGRRPSPLNSGSKTGSGARVAAQGGLRTPSPSVAFQARQKRQAQERQHQQKRQRQQGRRDRDMTDDDSDAYVEQHSDLLGSQGRKLTPTRRGPDLYLNVE